MNSSLASGLRNGPHGAAAPPTGSQAVARLSGSLRVTLYAEPGADRAAGIVSLFNGEPDFATPAWICEAATEAMRHGFTHYPLHQGDVELRETIAELLNEQHGLDYTRDDILVTNGASSAIYASITALVDPGDEVVLLDPCWAGYQDAINMAGAVPVRAALGSDFHLDPEALDGAISPRSKMLVVCNPGNPTAVVFSRSELEAIARIAREHDLLVLADEVYDHIVYDDRPFISTLAVPELAERTLLVQSFSKSYAMTGWRLGYVAAKRGRAQLAGMAHRTALQFVNSITQRAGLAALRAKTESEAWFRDMLAVYDRRRRLGQQLLEQIPRARSRLPEGTFYFWVKVDTALSSVELIRYLRDTGRVSVHPGTEYGPNGEGYIRLSFANAEAQVREGIARIGEALAKLNH